MDRREFLLDAAAATAAMSIPSVSPGDGHTLPTRPIPSTGEALPIIGFGNSSAFEADDNGVTEALLDVLVEMGGKFIDTNGRSQVSIGRYMRDRDAHDALFLGTYIAAADSAADAAFVADAKRHQGKASLDLLQLARPQDFDRQWARMRALRDEGHARYIGMAIAGPDWYDTVERLIRSGTADFIQLNYSMLEPESGDLLIPMAADQGMAVVTNRPFVNGRWFPMVRDRTLPEWAAEFDCGSWAQFSLKFIASNPLVTCAITETSKTHHAIDNLSAGLGRLPDEATRQRMLELVRSF